jgi:hypothetical protein
MNGEDLDAIDAAPATADPECFFCRFPWWSCLCSTLDPQRQPTEAELEAAREARLVRAETGEP